MTKKPPKTIFEVDPKLRGTLPPELKQYVSAFRTNPEATALLNHIQGKERADIGHAPGNLAKKEAWAIADNQWAQDPLIMRKVLAKIIQQALVDSGFGWYSEGTIERWLSGRKPKKSPP